MKNGLNPVILDEQLQDAAVDILHNTRQHLRTADHLCMLLIMCQDGADIKWVEAIWLRKTRKTSFDLGHLYAAFVDNFKTLASYVRAFDLQYGVKFIHVLIKGIVDDTLMSKYLPPRSQATFL